MVSEPISNFQLSFYAKIAIFLSFKVCNFFGRTLQHLKKNAHENIKNCSQKYHTYGSLDFSSLQPRLPKTAQNWKFINEIWFKRPLSTTLWFKAIVTCWQLHYLDTIHRVNYNKVSNKINAFTSPPLHNPILRRSILGIKAYLLL